MSLICNNTFYFILLNIDLIGLSALSGSKPVHIFLKYDSQVLSLINFHTCSSLFMMLKNGLLNFWVCVSRTTAPPEVWNTVKAVHWYWYYMKYSIYKWEEEENPGSYYKLNENVNLLSVGLIPSFSLCFSFVFSPSLVLHILSLKTFHISFYLQFHCESNTSTLSL